MHEYIFLNFKWKSVISYVKNGLMKAKMKIGARVLKVKVFRRKNGVIFHLLDRVRI